MNTFCEFVKIESSKIELEYFSCNLICVFDESSWKNIRLTRLFLLCQVQGFMCTTDYFEKIHSWLSRVSKSRGCDMRFSKVETSKNALTDLFLREREPSTRQVKARGIQGKLFVAFPGPGFLGDRIKAL